MKVKRIALIVGGIVVIGGGIYLGTHKKSTSGSTTTNSQTSSTSQTPAAPKKACDLFTLADAKQILGANTKLGTTAAATDASTADVDVSTCTYDNGSTVATDLQTSTVLVRNGLTSTGKASNQSGFNQDKTTHKGVDVTSLGDGAHYNADLGQLNVLSGNYWLIIASGMTDVSKHTQTQATQIAQLVIPKLAAVAATDNSTATGAGTSGSTASSLSSSTGATTTKTDPKLGEFLADANGKPLYTNIDDKPGVANCAASCLTRWPLYESTASSSASLPKNITVIKRSDGKSQYAYKAMALYFFKDDTNSTPKGDGLNDFKLARP